jgi:uncharacterized protein YpuA (DUF1002 family)
VPIYLSAVVNSYNVDNNVNDKMQHHIKILAALKQEYIKSLGQLNEVKQQLEKTKAEK